LPGVPETNGIAGRADARNRDVSVVHGQSAAVWLAGHYVRQGEREP